MGPCLVSSNVDIRMLLFPELLGKGRIGRVSERRSSTVFCLFGFEWNQLRWNQVRTEHVFPELLKLHECVQVNTSRVPCFPGLAISQEELLLSQLGLCAGL